MAERLERQNSVLHDKEIQSCSCGLLHFLGFHHRPHFRGFLGCSYIRLDGKDNEIVDAESKLLIMGEHKGLKLEEISYSDQIKSWITRKINRKHWHKPKLIPGSPRLSRTGSIHHLECTKYMPPKESENIKEINWILIDGLLHKIPYGQKVPEEMAKVKLFRSLSADYDVYTSINNIRRNLANGKAVPSVYRRICSSPASVNTSKCGESETAASAAARRSKSSAEGQEEIPAIPINHGHMDKCETLVSLGEIEMQSVEQAEPPVIVDPVLKDSNKELTSTPNGLLEEKIQTKVDQKVDSRLNHLKEAPNKFNSSLEELSHLNEVSITKLDSDDVPLDQVLIFDLINELYYEIYEKYSSLSPWYSGNVFRLNSKLVEGQVFKEVQSSVNWYSTDLQKKNIETVEDLIGQDFARDHKWMNLKFDKANVGVELGFLILDDLLEKLVVEVGECVRF